MARNALPPRSFVFVSRDCTAGRAEFLHAGLYVRHLLACSAVRQAVLASDMLKPGSVEAEDYFQASAALHRLHGYGFPRAPRDSAFLASQFRAVALPASLFEAARQALGVATLAREV